MRINIGDVCARCARCGGEEFQPLPAPAPAQDLMCFGCGTVVTRRALLGQIAERTMTRAERFLQRSKKLRAQPRKS